MKRIALISIIMVLMALGEARGQNVELVGSCNLPGWGIDIFELGNYAYVAEYSNGLQIIDISNPAAPIFAGSYDTPDHAYGVYVRDSIAYVANGQTGLLIINVSAPSNPVLIGNYNTPGEAFDVVVQDDYAYVADNFSGIQIVNISDPENPNLVGSYDTGAPNNVFVSGAYAYTTEVDSYGGDNYGYLYILGVEEPVNPHLSGSYYFHARPWGVSVLGNYAYLACSWSYSWPSNLMTLNIGNPSQPQFVGAFILPDEPRNIQIVDSFAYLADMDSGVVIIDISNPAHPTKAGSYITPDPTWNVYVNDSYIYATDLNPSTFYVLHFTLTGIDEINPTPNNSFSLSQSYPNPFNAQTTISYSMPKASDISLDIFDILGCKIATLQSGHQEAGEHSVIWNAGDKPSGIYFYRLKAGEREETNRMVLIK
jgi:hypothetical protein